MTRAKCALITVGAMVFAGVATKAYEAPQAHWVWEEHRGWSVTSPCGIVMHDRQLFVLSESKVKVYETNGDLVREFGSAGDGDGQFTDPQYLAIHGGEIFVTDSSANRVQVFDLDGNFLRKWGSTGTGPGEFSVAKGIAVDENHVFVTDYNGNRVQAFLHDGTFDYQFGEEGTLPGQLLCPRAVTLDENHIYVTDGHYDRYAQYVGDAQIQVYLKDGTFVREWGTSPKCGNAIAVDGTYVYVCGKEMRRTVNNGSSDGRIYIGDKLGNKKYGYSTGNWSGAVNRPFYRPRGIALQSPFVYISDNKRNRIEVFRMVFRTGASPASLSNGIPSGAIVSVQQRPGTAILDVEFKVADDDATVAAWPLAFNGSTSTDLSTAIPMRTLVEGTDAEIGASTPTNTIHKLSWDMSADWGIDYGDVRVAIFAKDTRNLLDIHFLHLPAVPVNNAPAIIISRRPVQENDLLNLWFWLIASGDAGIQLVNGEIHGIGGEYDGHLLAQGTTTTAEGRAYLWDKLGVREATADEVQKAKEASTPGTIAQREARYPKTTNSKTSLPPRPTFLPAQINEFSFDTSTTTGWWVVKE